MFLYTTFITLPSSFIYIQNLFYHGQGGDGSTADPGNIGYKGTHLSWEARLSQNTFADAFTPGGRLD